MSDRVQAVPTGRSVIGRATGQPELGGAAGSRSLGEGGSVLPELAEAPTRVRRWWLHPAFVVSMILTVLAIAAAATWFIISIVTDDSVRVDGLSISMGDGMAHLDWSGPDAAYGLYAVSGDGAATDLSQWVRGTEAWIPQAAGVFDDRTCFVVRPGGETAEVSLDTSTLASQRGGSVCVTDAAS